MTRKPSLQLFLLLILLGCMVPPAAAGFVYENPWVYEPTNGIYGMYDETNDVFWVYDPLDDVFWKLDVYNGEISGLTGYSISYDLDYDPSGSYDLFWVLGAVESEIYAYDPGSDQVFLYDFHNAVYWVYEPDSWLVWDYASEGEMFSDAGDAFGAGSEAWDGDWAEDWVVEEDVDSSLSSESESFITNEELVEGLLWHETETDGYFWSYAPARDIFLMYAPYNGALAVYGPRTDLWYYYGEADARDVNWQREGNLGIVWVYDANENLFWIYYPEDEFIQGYALSRELFWDFPVENLNFAGDAAGRVQNPDDRVVVADNTGDSSGGGLILLLLIVGGLFVLKRRKSKKNRVNENASSPVPPGPATAPVSEKKPSDNGENKEKKEKKGFGRKVLKKETPASGKKEGMEPESASGPASPVGAVPHVDAASPVSSVPHVDAASRVGAGSGFDAAPPVKDSVSPIVDAVPPFAASAPAPVSSSSFSSSGDAQQAEGVVEENSGEGESRSAEVSPVEGFPAALLSKYEPLELLGKGGFAAVFKAKRKVDGELVALKIPRIDEKTSSYFIKEVAAWYNLNHPNIVRLYKSDLLPVPYLEMEFVEGVEHGDRQVRELEKYPKPLPEADALKLIRGIAAGLSHAHSRGIYHHDLKPLNILVGAGMSPKITDFGLAKIGARNSLTTHNAYSPLYAAPEQLDEDLYGKPDRRTDIYQLGLVFYELLAGKLPYSGCSMGAVLGKILSKDVKPEAVSKALPSLGRYDGILERLLAQEKAGRYQEVSEFLAALDALEKLDREEAEMKQSLEISKQTLKMSTSREEVRRITCEVVEKTAKVALLYAGVNEKPELLKALEELRGYAGENLPELDSAVSQLEYMVRNGVPVGKEFEEGLKVLLDRIGGDVRKG